MGKRLTALKKFAVAILVLLLPVLADMYREDVFLSGAAAAETDGGQEGKQDSLVRLIRAEGSARLVEVGGVSFRKIIGPATFLHNNTYLKCDSALWNVDSNYINALGNVSVRQKETVLYSDSLHYIVALDLAQFRGSLVELIDRDSNVLRTRNLDYHTKDSVATFFGGGAMVDKDGNVIESENGKYESKSKVFTFVDRVKMHSDGMLVYSDRMVYYADTDLVTFGTRTKIWNEDNFLSAYAGVYLRPEEEIRFWDRCYMLTPDQEIYSDSLKYLRYTKEAELFRNVQIEDIEQQSILFGDYAYMKEEPFYAVMTERPSLASYGYENGVPDTMFVSADTFMVYNLLYRQVDSMEKVNAVSRLDVIKLDPIGDLVRKDKEKAEKAREEAEAARTGKVTSSSAKSDAAASGRPSSGTGSASRKSAPKQGSIPDSGKKDGGTVGENAENQSVADSASVAAGLSVAGAEASAEAAVLPVDSVAPSIDSIAPPVDSVAFSVDSVAPSVDSLPFSVDSMSSSVDSLVVPDQAGPIADSMMPAVDSAAMAERAKFVADSLARDTMEVNFIKAFRNVRLFKGDMQGKADSMIYTSLDSITRLYREPVMWNGPESQYSSDSMFIVTENKTLKKANLMGASFVISQQDANHFNQIKSTEMIAFFRDNEIVRYDALGGVSTIFYLEEDGEITTMNPTSAKMLTVNFLNREVQRLKYIGEIKNDAWSLAEIKEEQKKLKDFRWLDTLRPEDRFDVCGRAVKPSDRVNASALPYPTFSETNFYFDGYMVPVIEGLLKQKDTRDSVRVEEEVKEQERRAIENEQKQQAAEERQQEEKKNDIRRTVVSEGKVSYFILYLGEDYSGNLTSMKVSFMKDDVRDMRKEMKRLDKAGRKFMKKHMAMEEKRRKAEKSVRGKAGSVEPEDIAGPEAGRK